MNTTPDEQNEFTRRIIRRILASNALQRMRRMMKEMEREEAVDRKLLRAWMIVPIILALAAILIYLNSSFSTISIELK